MDLKNRKSSTKMLNKSNSSASLAKRKPTPTRQSSKKRHTQTKTNISQINPISNIQTINKKHQSQTLVKKKIQDLKTPDLLIKVNYKSKRLSIPIYQLDDKNLNQIVLPHILKFEKQILKNSQFDFKSIENWKTISPSDILKDYYFQTNKPLAVFKGQILNIQPIFKKQQVQKVSLSDFQIIKCIGTGGFSRVFLVRLKATGKFYALKLMQKQGLLQTGKQCVVINQRQIMVGIDNDQILKLQFAFQTKHFVALGLQYCPGGQLFYYLRKVRRMTQQEARYCFIEVLLGIQYLHNKKIIYRDIKPQNIMIDADGGLKIADFGLSKIGLKPSDLAYTYCGSPQYMAPQMLSKSGHNYCVDYYCLGALLYQLVTGNPPFYSRDVQKIYYSIQNQDIQFPSHVDLSPQIKMLLEGLLVKDPKRRLGSLGGVRQILGHPWVRKLKTCDILQKKVPTPIKIDLLTFNVNEQQVQEGQNNFGIKLEDQNQDFELMFQDFYFQRNAQNSNILDDCFNSVKSDSTKQNKSLVNKIRNERDRQKIIIKGLSQEKRNNKQKILQSNYISLNNHIKSQSRGINNISSSGLQLKNIDVSKTKLKKKTKKHHQKHQPELVQRSKKRDLLQKQKSVNKLDKKLGSPKPKQTKNSLTRVKSSTGLLGGNTLISKNHRY